MTEIERLAELIVATIKAATTPIVSKLKALEARVSALPEGRNGEDGRDGKDGAPGRDGLPGVQGPKGNDGTNGRDGINGKDGMDGLGFDDLLVEHDGERGFTFKFVQGDRVKTFGAFTIPCVIYRGIYVAGKSYTTGDCVTWGGSTWIAESDTNAKPGDPGQSSRAWRLSVKKGSDGKQGEPGKSGKDGADGRNGKDWGRG